MSSSLPQEVLDLVVFSPIEDLVLALLRDRLPESIPVQSLIADDQTFPLVLVRRTSDWGSWRGDGKFVDSGQVVVHTLTQGLNADSDSAYLAEAVRVILRDSVNKVVPERGYLTSATLVSSPRRVTDWATATGPVQYADLPTGVVRYETTYELGIRAPRK